MTQQERAQVAFKVMGVLLIVVTLGQMLGMFWWFADLFREAAGDDGAGLGVGSALSLVAVTHGLAIGAVLVWAAPGLGRLLLPVPAQASSPGQETLRIGTCLVGVILLMRLARVLALAVPMFHGAMEFLDASSLLAALAPAASMGLLGVVLVLAARRMSSGRLGGPAAVLAAGIVLVAMYRAAIALEGLVAGMCLGSLRGPESPEFAAYFFHMRVNALLTSTIAVILAAMTALFSTRIAGRPAVARGADGSAASSVRVGGTAAVALAVLVGAAYLFVGHLRGLMHSPFFHWQGAEAVGALLHLLVVPALVGFAVFWLAGRIAGPVARRLHKPSEPDAEAAAPPLRLLLEVALAVLGLYYLQSFLWRATTHLITFDDPRFVAVGFGRRAGVLLAALACAGVLAFKGDLARLACRGEGGGGPPREVRAALLRPWLLLLGVWLVLGDGPGLVSWACTALLGSASEWPMGLPPWGVVPGVLLIVCARWLAGLLAYGPLLRRARLEPAET